LQIGFRHFDRHRECVGEPVSKTRIQWIAVSRDQLGREFQGGRDGNLLAKHGADSDFEAVPGARYA
jgi:hypothetical protein